MPGKIIGAVGVVSGGTDGRETGHFRQIHPPEDGSSGQALPPYQVPETQPEAGLHPGPLVLSELSPGNGASHIPCRLNRSILPGVRGKVKSHRQGQRLFP